MRNFGATVTAGVLIFVFASPLGAEQDPAKTARYFLDRGDCVQAAQYFESALTRNPDQKGLRVFCAFAYFKQNQFDRAEEHLKREVALFTDSEEALVLLAAVYYRQGRGAEAESVCRDVAGSLEKRSAPRDSSGRRPTPGDLTLENPNLGLPNFILGLLDKQHGRFGEAVDNFGKARELGYDPLACHLHILDAELGRRAWERVMALAPNLRERGGGASAEARTFQAIALDEKRLDQEARDCLERAAALKPLAPWTLKNLAIYLLNRDRFEDSLPFIRKALRVAPQDYQARFLLEQAEGRRHAVDWEHRLVFTREFLDEFVPVYRHTFARDPKDIAREVQNFALGLIREGLLADAALALKNFLDLYDQSPSLNYNLAQLYNAMDRCPEALRYGLRAVELQADSRDAHDLVGNILFKTGDLEESAAFYRRALALAPDDALAYYNLGCAYRALRDDAGAEKNWLLASREAVTERAPKSYAERARRADDLNIDLQVRAEPAAYDAWVSLGALYLEQKKPAAALDAFAHASQILPLRQEPHLNMGRIYIDLNDRAKAKECFDKYVSLGGDEAKVKEFIK